MSNALFRRIIQQPRAPLIVIGPLPLLVGRAEGVVLLVPPIVFVGILLTGTSRTGLSTALASPVSLARLLITPPLAFIRILVGRDIRWTPLFTALMARLRFGTRTCRR